MFELKKIEKSILLGLSLIGLIIILLILLSNSSNYVEKLHLANPNDKDFFEEVYVFAEKTLNLSNKNVIGGIIPHHLLAADLIANFFKNLEGKKYDSVILIGPNHFLLGDSDIIISQYNWQTPYGILECDKDLVEKLLKQKNLDIQIDEKVLGNDHSINSEVAFIKKTFPSSKLMSLILKPSFSEVLAKKIAQVIYEISKDKNVLVLVSVDFSHYKNSLEAQTDDKKSIDVITQFNFSEIYNIKVDSPSSVYLLLRYSQLHDATFKLLDNSNSAILSNRPDLASTTSYITGYLLN